jgi:hypothetical protein
MGSVDIWEADAAWAAAFAAQGNRQREHALLLLQALGFRQQQPPPTANGVRCSCNDRARY